MTASPATRTLALVALALAGSVARAQAPSTSPSADHATPAMTSTASGTFDVSIRPQPADDYADGGTLARMTIDKRFHGDLDATSRGQMPSGGSVQTGSAGYVAIERVSGTLGGRRGSFILQHSGTMDRGAQRLTITVVPGSGTDELSGLAGTMTIDAGGGKHAYRFAYSLPAPATR